MTALLTAAGTQPWLLHVSSLRGMLNREGKPLLALHRQGTPARATD
jgi:hypothetical protein